MLKNLEQLHDCSNLIFNNIYRNEYGCFNVLCWLERDVKDLIYERSTQIVNSKITKPLNDSDKENLWQIIKNLIVIQKSMLDISQDW
jgi:hypothetical protein